MSDDSIRLPEGRVVRDLDDTEGQTLDWLLFGDVYLKAPERAADEPNHEDTLT